MKPLTDEERMVLLFKYLFSAEAHYSSQLNQIQEEFSRHEFHSDEDYLRLFRAEVEVRMFDKLFADIGRVLFDF